MERVITSIDQHGRMLIPLLIREKFKMYPGEKVTIEIDNNELKIINADHTIDEMHNLFMKNKNDNIESIVDDFINTKRQEYFVEEKREKSK